MVILPLMQPVELVQCIKCGGDEYFIWKLSPFFTCTSLLPSSAPGLVDLMVNLWSSEEYLSLVLLKRTYHSPWFFKQPYPNWSEPILTYSWDVLSLGQVLFYDSPSSIPHQPQWKFPFLIPMKWTYTLRIQTRVFHLYSPFLTHIN